MDGKKWCWAVTLSTALMGSFAARGETPKAAAAPTQSAGAGSDSDETSAADEAEELRAEHQLTHQEMQRWDRLVRGFRREHNFALTTGVSSGTWHVQHFGTLADRSFDNSGVYSRFQYSFHLPLYRGFGYMLGSSAGYHYETADSRSAFKPVAAPQFPGLLVGLVLNISPVLRLAVGAESYLERHNNIEARSPAGGSQEISVTMVAYDAGMFIDIFYDLNWALRCEGHARTLSYRAPYNRAGDNFPVNAAFSKTDQWLGLGVVYHLL